MRPVLLLLFLLSGCLQDTGYCEITAMCPDGQICSDTSHRCEARVVPTGASCTESWCPVTGLVLPGLSLTALFASGPADVWTAGGAPARKTGVLFHFDGRVWTQVDLGMPDPPLLTDLSGLGPSAAWASGAGGMVLHDDGMSWMPLPIQAPENQLAGIWAAGPASIWTAGTQNPGSGGFLTQFDGTGWHNANLGAALNLNGIWGSGAMDAWAVGQIGTVYHWDGMTWTIMKTIATETLNHVSGSGLKDVWMVGQAGAVYHYDGGSWSKVSHDGGTVTLFGVWAGGPADAWVVGDQGTILRWDGTALRRSSSGTKVALRAVSAAGGMVWAVGDAGTILLHRAP